MNEKLFSHHALTLLLAALWFMPMGAEAISIGNPAPDIVGEPWINSKPLTLNVLKGRVVMVEFWTYG